MRRYLHIIAFMLLAVLPVACDVHELPGGETDIAVTLHLKYDTAMPQYTTVDFTKAGSGVTDWQVRYVVKLFKYASDTYSRTPAYTFTWYGEVAEGLDRTINLKAEAADYRVVVWTDYVKAGTEEGFFYDAEDFSEVKLSGTYYGQDEHRDCFYGSNDLEMATLLTYDASYEATVELGRPLARFNFISTDREKFIDYWIQQVAIRNGSFVKMDRGSLDLNKFHVRWVYPQFLPNTFNLHNGRPVDSATGVRFDAEMSVREDGNVDLGFDWMFVNPEGTESKVIVSLEIYDQDGTYVSTISNIEVPLMRSQQTTIIGNILTSGINNGVSIDPTYDGEFNIKI